MKKYAKNLGFTLTEMITVIGIIAVLAVVVFSMTDKVQTSSKVKLTENTLALVDNALSEFEQFGYQYRGADYSHLRFPIDCNDMTAVELANDINQALGDPGVGILDVAIADIDKQRLSSGSAAMHFFLSRVPQSRGVLQEIDVDLIESYGSITVSGIDYSLLYIVDPWGKPMRYSYYYNEIETESDSEPKKANPRSFPLVISAGPDGKFGTEDDIKNR